MDKLQNLMTDISNWSDQTFGNKHRNPSVLYHLIEEINELIYNFNLSNNMENKYSLIKEEFADCFILLLDSASHAGITANDLFDIIVDKMEINKKRKWGQPDKNGIIKHIK